MNMYGKQKAIIFDLDGTLSNCTHRLHYVERFDPDYDKFNALCYNDDINDEVVNLLKILSKETDYIIIICTGRMENVRELTREWLCKYDINICHLYMRGEGDFRSDVDVKKDMLDKIERYYEVILSFDDKDTCVDFWRENGIDCFKVS